MKLLVIAALIAVTAAGRLDSLERSYLPPGQVSTGFGSVGPSRSTFGAGSPGSFGSNSFGSGQRYSSGGFSGSPSNEYLPPSQGSAARNGPQFGGSSLGASARNFGSQSQNHLGQQYSAPSSQYGAPGSAQSRFQSQSQYSAPNTQYSSPSSQYTPNSQYSSNSQPRFQSQSQYSAPNTQYSSPSTQYSPNSQYSSNSQAGFQQPSIPSSQYGTPGSSPLARSQQFGAASRQYLAPRVDAQNYPQQNFDDQSGYQY